MSRELEAEHVRFSVVLPCYRTDEAVLEKAIRSVLDQSHESWELVVVDDNPEGSEYKGITRKIERCHTRDDRLRFIYHEGNLGANVARNDAIANSTGDWLAFLDSDDCWDRYYLENVARKIMQVDCALVSTSIKVYNGHGCRELVQDHEDGFVFEQEVKGDLFSPSSGVCVRRDALIETGGFDNSLPARQDYDMWLRVSRRYPVAFVSEPSVTVVRDGHESISSGYERHLAGTLAVLEKINSWDDLPEGLRTEAATCHYRYIVKFLSLKGQGKLARHYLKRLPPNEGLGTRLMVWAAPILPRVRTLINCIRYRG